MTDQTRWGISDIITQNKARAKEKQDFQNKELDMLVLISIKQI